MRVVLIPGVLALLPQHASLHDPVAELRAAVNDAVSRLGENVEIIATEQGSAVAEAVLAAVGPAATDERSVLVVANGSACRTEKAPGFLDERAAAYDDALRRALTEDPAALTDPDPALAAELWADVAALPELAALVDGARAEVLYDDAPYGVQYWVMCWQVEE
ncbi:MAG: hypothetical protein ACXVDH_00010 [Nocardioides sp.]